jgi:hypothetical protein
MPFAFKFKVRNQEGEESDYDIWPELYDDLEAALKFGFEKSDSGVWSKWKLKTVCSKGVQQVTPDLVYVMTTCDDMEAAGNLFLRPMVVGWDPVEMYREAKEKYPNKIPVLVGMRMPKAA